MVGLKTLSNVFTQTAVSSLSKFSVYYTAYFDNIVHISTLCIHTGGVVTHKLYLTLPRIGLNPLWTSSNYQLALVS